MHIALLEDDPDQAIVIEQLLLEYGYKCDVYASGRQLIQGLKRHSYDMLILDWVLPDISGIEVMQWVRNNLEWRIPIIFTTQMDREEDVVQVLGQGADDYMPKPVKGRELLARIEALGRRALANESPREILQFEPYSIDCDHRIVERQGKEIQLTQIEFDLVLYLFRNFGRVLSRAHILENVWGINNTVNTRTIDTHISRIRKKLNLGPDMGWQLRPVYQHGYRLERLRTNNGSC